MIFAVKWIDPDLFGSNRDSGQSPVVRAALSSKGGRLGQRTLTPRTPVEPQLCERVRAVGYAGLPLMEARAKADELAERFGKEVMIRCSPLVVRVDDKAGMAYLTDAVRPLCFQLLG